MEFLLRHHIPSTKLLNQEYLNILYFKRVLEDINYVDQQPVEKYSVTFVQMTKFEDVSTLIIASECHTMPLCPT